jgi:hypothetical protein
MAMTRSTPIALAALGIVAAGVCARLAGFTPAGAPAAQESAGVPMGTLVGRDFKVTILATDAGTRYDVRTPAGVLVASGLTDVELAQLFPGQDPRGFAAEPTACGPLMLAEPVGRGVE